MNDLQIMFYTEHQFAVQFVKKYRALTVLLVWQEGWVVDRDTGSK